MSCEVLLEVVEEIFELLEVAEKGDPGTPVAHNDLTEIQGGTVTERYHLTAAELSRVVTAAQKAALDGANSPAATNAVQTWDKAEGVIDATAGGTFALDYRSDMIYRVSVGTAAVVLNFINKPAGDNARGPTIRLKFTGATIPAVTFEDAGAPITFETWDGDVSDATPLVGVAKIELLYQDATYDALKWGVV